MEVLRCVSLFTCLVPFFSDMMVINSFFLWKVKSQTHSFFSKLLWPWCFVTKPEKNPISASSCTRIKVAELEDLWMVTTTGGLEEGEPWTHFAMQWRVTRVGAGWALISPAQKIHVFIYQRLHAYHGLNFFLYRELGIQCSCTVN